MGMAKPVLLTVDDDADVLHSIERDLRRHYGQRYRILSAESGTGRARPAAAPANSATSRWRCFWWITACRR